MTTAAAIRQLAHLAMRGRTEASVYRKASGATRTITILVTRKPPADLMSGASIVLEVLALNDASAGITPAELDAGADKLDVAERHGGTAAPRMIARVLAQDEEFLTLEMR